MLFAAIAKLAYLSLGKGSFFFFSIFFFFFFFFVTSLDGLELF